MKFNWDNIVFQMLGKLVDCVWVSILWVICCIPVFTIGASTTALYYTVHKSIRGDRGYTTRTFFGAFRDNFKAATLPYLIWLAVMIVLGCDAYITYQVLKTGSMKGAFFYFFLVMIAVAIMWSAFLFPYIARFENTVKQTLKNAFLLMIRHLPWALLLLVILVAFRFLRSGHRPPRCITRYINPSAVTADIPQEPFSERSGTTLRLQHCHILYGWPL